MYLSSVIDSKELFADYTTDIISTAAFGLEGHATRTGDSPMRAITRSFSSYNLQRTASFISIFFAPYYVDAFWFTFFPKKTTRFFREVFERIVAQRGGWEAGAGASGKGDLVDALLRLRQGPDLDGIEITEDIVLAQAAILLQGGFETTAVSLSFVSYELAYNPHVQAKLYDELKKAKSKKGEDLEPSDLAELTYLSCVIKENLRKYPAMGWLDRIAGYDYRVDDKLTIPRGTPVYVNAVGMHHSPKYFPDPLMFDPDRFLPENEGDIKPYSYMPFGDGPRRLHRACGRWKFNGMRLAQQNLRFAITALVLNFVLKPLEGAPAPDEVGVDNKALFLSPGCRLAVRFTPRTNSEDK
ncbi:Cytochrome P450 6k1 [Eumeta japonica]|uniref:unspecific monooxygenase n=1 Tax=Eumeta variegata TaxID=151549 RepID=A0A4C1ZEU5_EUMVA|nr:Cytochrome P450 6k1 [Eumeta japonica]